MPSYIPETPGSEIEFDKPNIPFVWDGIDFSVDTEIMTEEKFLGKTIYAKMVEISTGSSNGIKQIEVPFEENEVAFVINVDGNLETSSGSIISLNYNDGSNTVYISAACQPANNRILLNVVHNGSSFHDLSGYAIVYYTKN